MTTEQRAKIVDAIKVFGASEVARRLGLSREATLGLAIPGVVHNGTEAQAVRSLAKLDGARDVLLDQAAHSLEVLEFLLRF